jgi:hypothetical protein
MVCYKPSDVEAVVSTPNISCPSNPTMYWMETIGDVLKSNPSSIANEYSRLGPPEVSTTLALATLMFLIEVENDKIVTTA